MENQDKAVQILEHIAGLAPCGCALALHFKFTAPTYLLQTYDADWTSYYTQNSFVMRDPVVAWGLGHTGAQRWSFFADQDPAGVMAAAADHGLGFGVVIAVYENDSRSVCGFARNDREFEDGEIADLSGLVAELHALTLDESQLTQEDRAALRRLSAGATKPY